MVQFSSIFLYINGTIASFHLEGVSLHLRDDLYIYAHINIYKSSIYNVCVCVSVMGIVMLSGPGDLKTLIFFSFCRTISSVIWMFENS